MNFRFFILFFISLVVYIPFKIFAQLPEIIWQHSYGGSERDQANVLKQTIDSGFIIAGFTLSNDEDVLENSGLYDYWLLKLNKLGEIEWQKSYGGTGYDYCYDAENTIDGGYILVGSSNSNDVDVSGNHGEEDVWVVKLDEFGEIMWQKSLGGSEGDGGSSISLTDDGGYIIAGSSSSNDGDVSEHHGGSPADYWVIKLNDLGDIEWQKSLGSFGTDIAHSIIQTSDGEYLVVGFSETDGGDVTGNHGYSDYWVVKLNNEGDLLWQRSLGGSDDDIAYSAIESLDSGFLIIGETYSNNGDVSGFLGGKDVWVVKLSPLGNIEWTQCYGGTGGEQGMSIQAALDENFIFSANSSSTDGDLTINNGQNDYWAVKINPGGDTIWQKSIGGSQEDLIPRIIETYEGAYVLAGFSSSSDFDLTENNGEFDYWIVKLDICDNHYFADADNDGFGDIMNDSMTCEALFGYVLDSTDCNDIDSTINPSSEDVCNSIDDNCNGALDEDAVYYLWHLDADNDGFGTLFNDSLSCFELIGYVGDSTDCDDTNPDIYPGAPELLNGIDDDCDSLTDEDLSIDDPLFTSISIYPNPTEDILYIEFNDQNYPELEIITLTGQIIFTGEIISSLTEIDVSGFASGIYLVKLYSSDGGTSIPFVRE